MIGERLKELRENLGETQMSFSKKLEITHRTYVRYENNERSPDTVFLNILSEKFHVDLNWFVSGKGNIFKTNNVEIDLRYLRSDLFEAIFSEKITLLKRLSRSYTLADEIMMSLFISTLERFDIEIVKMMILNLQDSIKASPIKDRIFGLLTSNETGITVRIWSIISGAEFEVHHSPKEAMIHYAKFGFFAVPPSKTERELLAHVISEWPDELCMYLSENQKAFLKVIKLISTEARASIESNERFINLIGKYLKIKKT